MVASVAAADDGAVVAGAAGPFRTAADVDRAPFVPLVELGGLADVEVEAGLTVWLLVAFERPVGRLIAVPRYGVDAGLSVGFKFDAEEPVPFVFVSRRGAFAELLRVSSSAFRFREASGLEAGGVVVCCTGSPVIWARRFPIWWDETTWN